MKKALSLASIRKMASRYPGVEEGTSYGTPAWRVRKKLLARMHDEGPWLVLGVEDVDEQEVLVARSPEAFLVTDHYVGHPWVLAHLEGATLEEIESVFEAAWRRSASKTQLAQLAD